MTFGRSQVVPQGAEIPKAAGRRSGWVTRENINEMSPKRSYAHPASSTCGPETPQKTNHLRLCGTGKMGGKATEVLVAKEVVEGGTRREELSFRIPLDP